MNKFGSNAGWSLITNRLLIYSLLAVGLIIAIIFFNPNPQILGFPTKGNFSAYGYQWLCYGHSNLTCIIANPPADYLDGGIGGNTTVNGIKYSCDVFGVHLWCSKQ